MSYGTAIEAIRRRAHGILKNLTKNAPKKSLEIALVNLSKKLVEG